jgi:GNAT superfamily N-acetyltransferase
MPKAREELPTIKEIISPESIEKSAGIICEAFQTVARDFGLTRENNPTHPSFITAAQLGEIKARGLHLFGLFQSNLQVGFVAIGPAQNGVFTLEKLAVLPKYRHDGYGKVLVRFALDYAVLQKANKVKLALINEHTVLKNWYLGQGFSETSVEKFPHLPFTVCFMEYPIS